MTKRFWNLLLARPAICAAILLMSAVLPAAANPVPARAKATTTKLTQQHIPQSPEKFNWQHQIGTNDALAQVTSVSQLSDVQPTDWAFQALQSLVERYGCIAGYPDGTFRGNRALTRYEFAAGLNACLDRVNELIATASGGVGKEDLTTLQRLQGEFSAELKTLRGRVDALEVATAELEANQFSTTTKLSGNIIASVASLFSGDNVNGNEANKSTVFVERARLELNTSFTGRDSLYTLISAGNFGGFEPITGTIEGELSYTRPQAEDNDFGLETVEYALPVGKSTEFLFGFFGAAFYDFSSTLTLFDGDGDAGALSLFATRNPIYNVQFGSGLGIRQQLGNIFELSAGYLAGDAGNPDSGSGLFNGPYGAIGQVVFKPSDRFNLGLTYVHSYNADDTGDGTSVGPFSNFEEEFLSNQGIPESIVPSSSNSYGVELSWHLSDKIVVGGWAGYTRTSLLSSVNGQFDRGDIEIWNYAVTLGFPDLGKEGNLLGFVFGMEPKVTNSSVAQVAEARDDSYHIEGFYQFQVTDRIAVTPGVIWITSPGFDNSNNDLVIGTIRTTFSF